MTEIDPAIVSYILASAIGLILCLIVYGEKPQLAGVKKKNVKPKFDVPKQEGLYKDFVVEQKKAPDNAITTWVPVASPDILSFSVTPTPSGPVLQPALFTAVKGKTSKPRGPNGKFQKKKVP